MIEFTGSLTGNCRKFLLRKQIIFQFIVSLMVFCTFFVFALALSFYLFLLPSGLIIIFSLIPPSKQSQKTFMPVKVFVDLHEEIIVQKCEKTERIREISSVKKIIDYGEWYYLKFYYLDRDLYFVCQKDLLTQGNLEMFESLFDGKVVKK